MEFIIYVISLIYIIAVTVKFWRMAANINTQVSLLGAMNTQLAKLVISSRASNSPD